MMVVRLGPGQGTLGVVDKGDSKVKETKAHDSKVKVVSASKDRVMAVVVSLDTTATMTQSVKSSGMALAVFSFTTSRR